MWGGDIGRHFHCKNCFVSLKCHRATYVYVKIAFLFFLLITHWCGVPASWATRHTTVCLDAYELWLVESKCCIKIWCLHATKSTLQHLLYVYTAVEDPEGNWIYSLCKEDSYSYYIYCFVNSFFHPLASQPFHLFPNSGSIPVLYVKCT